MTHNRKGATSSARRKEIAVRSTNATCVAHTDPLLLLLLVLLRLLSSTFNAITTVTGVYLKVKKKKQERKKRKDNVHKIIASTPSMLRLPSRSFEWTVCLQQLCAAAKHVVRSAVGSNPRHLWLPSFVCSPLFTRRQIFLSFSYYTNPFLFSVTKLDYCTKNRRTGLHSSTSWQLGKSLSLVY